MIRFLRNLVLVAVFASLSMIAIGLMIGTMDVSVQASDMDDNQVIAHPTATQIPVRQSLLVQDQEFDPEPQPEVTEEDLAVIEKRIKDLESKVCSLELDRNDEGNRVANIFKRLREKAESRQQPAQQAAAVCTESDPNCKSCNAVPTQSPTQRIEVVESQPAYVNSNGTYVTRSSNGTTYWRTTTSQGGRRKVYYGRR